MSVLDVAERIFEEKPKKKYVWMTTNPTSPYNNNYGYYRHDVKKGPFLSQLDIK